MSAKDIILIGRRRFRDRGRWRRGCRPFEMTLCVVVREEFNSVLITERSRNWFDVGMCKSVGVNGVS
jgi:hypothetical protein